MKVLLFSVVVMLSGIAAFCFSDDFSDVYLAMIVISLVFIYLEIEEQGRVA